MRFQVDKRTGSIKDIINILCWFILQETAGTALSCTLIHQKTVLTILQHPSSTGHCCKHVSFKKEKSYWRHLRKSITCLLPPSLTPIMEIPSHPRVKPEFQYWPLGALASGPQCLRLQSDLPTVASYHLSGRHARTCWQNTCRAKCSIKCKRVYNPLTIIWDECSKHIFSQLFLHVAVLQDFVLGNFQFLHTVSSVIFKINSDKVVRLIALRCIFWGWKFCCCCDMGEGPSRMLYSRNWCSVRPPCDRENFRTRDCIIGANWWECMKTDTPGCIG